MTKFKFIFLNVKQRRYRAVWLIKLSQAHHWFTENKLKNESLILHIENLTNISN